MTTEASITAIAEVPTWDNEEHISELRTAYKLITHTQARFLLAFAQCGSIAESCRRIGITSTNQFWWMHHDGDNGDAYRLAFATADELVTQNLEGEAHRRARDGVVRGVYYKGEKVDEYRLYSDELLRMLLEARRPDKYRSNVHITGSVTTYKEYGFNTDKALGIGQAQEPDKPDV